MADNKDKKADAKAKADADAKAKADADAKAKADAKPEYTVTTGMSLTSRRGILDSGDEVMPDCFNGGQKVFDSLRKRGFITKT